MRRLSITEWRPITGSIPPLSATDWETEFAKYRSSPEYEVLNPQMDLADFQRIFWMEWIHRQWGRVIGVSFLLPSIYFVARGRACARTAATLAGITGLIGFQGFIGWWMVKSGLRDDLFAAGSHPRVSQYRLAAHLGTAFACYSSMLLAGLAVLRDSRPFDAAAASQPPRPLSLRLLRRSVAGLAALVFATAVSGALVAGLDAGLIYNEFPYMGTGFTPPVAELFDPAYSHVPDRSDLIWRNMLENPSLVQLDHRVMAVTTFSAVVALWSYTRFNPPMRILLAPAVRRAISAVMAVASLQVTLGLTTLLYLIPTPVAAAHQAGSLALLTSLLVLWTRLGSPRRAATLLRQGKTFIGFTHTFPSKSTLPQAPAKWGMTRT